MWWCLMSMNLSAQVFTEDALDDLDDLAGAEDVDTASPFVVLSAFDA